MDLNSNAKYWQSAGGSPMGKHARFNSIDKKIGSFNYKRSKSHKKMHRKLNKNSSLLKLKKIGSKNPLNSFKGTINDLQRVISSPHFTNIKSYLVFSGDGGSVSPKKRKKAGSMSVDGPDYIISTKKSHI
jgi:hypothetical protein